MTYLGNPPDQQAFAPAVDYFSGNGSTTSFTLSRSVGSVAQLAVVVANVVQNPSSAYTISGNTITFTGAPPAGTNNIWVRYTSPITKVMQPGQGTVGPKELDVSGGSGSGSMILPAGTTVQRPVNATAGQMRFNTTTSEFEFYNGGGWFSFTQQPAGTYTAEFLVIGGGGAGGYTTAGWAGAGGGAGGGVYGSTSVAVGTAYTVIVGAGGATSATNGTGASGGNSVVSGGSITTLTAYGGGGGAGYASAYNVGANGGCGGGSENNGGTSTATQGTGGSIAYGYGGGAGQSGGNVTAGGGGGLGAAGNATGQGNGGSGFNTYSVWASATSTGVGGFYGGGGGGGSYGSTGGTGGAGGGGAGGSTGGTSGVAGTAGTGGGGGGRGQYNAGSGTGGAGGSGIIIIRYAGSQRGVGGTYAYSNGYSYHTFTTSGTFTFTA